MKNKTSLSKIVFAASLLLVLGATRSSAQTLGAFGVNDSVAAAHQAPAVHPVLADEGHDQPAAEAAAAPVVVPKLAASSNEKENAAGTPVQQSPAKPKDEN